VVLGSASPRRAQLARDAGIEPIILPAPGDEPRPVVGEAPRDYALRAATWKADAVCARILRERPDLADALVIASDTVADLAGTVLGKPADDADARRILRALSNTTHTVWTALVLRSVDGSASRSGVDGTGVTMRPLTDAEINTYVASGEANGKAGAYAVQETGDRFVVRLEGAFDTVVGLPVRLLTQFLAELAAPSA
jgi:septum formation protein